MPAKIRVRTQAAAGQSHPTKALLSRRTVLSHMTPAKALSVTGLSLLVIKTPLRDSSLSNEVPICSLRPI